MPCTAFSYTDLSKINKFRDHGRYIKCDCPYNCGGKNTFIWYREQKTGKCYKCEQWSFINNGNNFSNNFSNFSMTDSTRKNFGIAWDGETKTGKTKISISLNMASAPEYDKIMENLSTKYPEDSDFYEGVGYKNRSQENKEKAYVTAIKNLKKTEEKHPDFRIYSTDLAIYNFRCPRPTDAGLKKKEDEGEDREEIKELKYAFSVGALWKAKETDTLSGNITINNQDIPIVLEKISEEDRTTGNSPHYNVLIERGKSNFKMEGDDALTGYFGEEKKEDSNSQEIKFPSQEEISKDDAEKTKNPRDLPF